MEAPALPDGLQEAIKTVRATFRLVWNEKAVITTPGYLAVDGTRREPEYEPRWQVWDTDPEGADYKLHTLQNPDGTFRQPEYWLVEFLSKINPERFGGNLALMVLALVDEPEFQRQAGDDKNASELFAAVGRMAEDMTKIKVGPATKHRTHHQRQGLMTFPESEHFHPVRGSKQIIVPG